MTAQPLPTNAHVADALERIGDLLEISGEQSRHRVLAYRRGAARVRGASESVAALALAGRAVELPDIGATLQDKIAELATTEEIGALTRLRERVPDGLADVARLQGIGPRRARLLWEALGVRNVADLAAAVSDGRVGGVQGFGPKLVQQVGEQLAAIAAGDAPETRFPLGRVLPLAEGIVADLASTPGVHRIEIAGGLRRGSELVHDVDVAVAADEPGAVTEAIERHPAVTEVASRGDAGIAVMTQAGIRVEFRIAPPSCFGNLLQHLTGSKAHNIRLRELAVRKGMSVSEHGITGPDGTLAQHADEEGVYGALGLPFVAPELREDDGELDQAVAGTLPMLVEVDDLQGDLHTHTTWSDGRDSLEAMVAAADAMGLRYLAVSDHSKSLGMAGGLDEERVRRQWEEIDAINERGTGAAVLKATEVDVLSDGRLDFDDELLSGFDWVTASLHSGFSQDPERLTKRVLAAIENPYVNAIGHPTGRMLGRREGYSLDFDRVFERAAATGTALEINSQPRRLDLSADLARRALAAGVRLVIGTDAHSTGELAFRRFGVLVARRAGASADRIVNALPLDGIRALRRQSG